GAPNIFIALRRESGSNVIDIKREMVEEIAAINIELLNPAGMQIELMADDVRYVQESVRNVWQNLMLGALLATTVMFLFLRSLRATLVGVMGIPICIIVAFLGLLIAGRTINVISLAGIAFAIGMTLDNSIVVLESIELERRRGADRLQAALRGIQQVWPAVFASTMTTVLVFIPVAFVEQEAGQLYSDVAIAISAAILASMLVAVTALPSAAARLNFSDRGASAPDANSRHRAREATLAIVGSLLATSRRRLACIGITVLLSALIIWKLTPAAEYLPEGEEPKVFAVMNAPPGYNLTTMLEIGNEVQDYLLDYVGKEPGLFKRGDSEMPAIAYFNMRVQAQQLRIIAEPVDAADIERLMKAITRKYQEYP
ncbi:MAG: efflux RND transporter permease subunit, partial [Pseudomonadales bacterium]|nr:efflux RND transporter permease subunit [Pseudomonadales bacterium]